MQTTPKRQTRPGRTPKPTGSAAATPRRSGPRPTTLRVVERIVELQMHQVPLETFAAEMVPLLLDAFDAPAGALLLYGCESETLTMLSSRGLSSAGKERLLTLRRGAADSWEIPLHGLLNRKAYIIEQPDEHPFVPELVDRELVPRTTNLASIPLYRGQLPVAVLIAIADHRPIVESEILLQVLAFNTLALALDGYIRMRSLSHHAAPARDTSGDEQPLVCEPWVEPREIAARLEEELGNAQLAHQALAERLADTEARLAASTVALDRTDGDRVELAADRDAAIERAVAAERRRLETSVAEARAAVAARDRALAALTGEREQALALVGGERDRALAAAADAGDVVRQLRGTIATVENEREALRAERARVLAAVDEPGAEPATVIRALREKIAALEGEIGAHATERAELARRAAVQAEQVAQQLAAQRQEVEELRGTQERGLAELRLAHARALEDERARQGRGVADATAASERARADDEIRHETLITALRAEYAETLGRAVAERDARRDEAERLGTERDDLEARLTWALADREEVAAAASVRERGALATLETERREAASMRAAFDQERAAIELGRAEDAQRLIALEHEIATRDDRLTASAREVEERDEQLAAVRAEVARLHEDRDRVLAVVDDPGAEPGAVIQALRERVASAESQAAALEEEKRQAMQRAAAEIEDAEHRVAVQRREIAEARAAQRTALEEAQATLRRELEQAHVAHRAEREADAAAHRDAITALHVAADRVDVERRTTLTQLEYDRDAALAAGRELRSTLAARETRLGELERMHTDFDAERARLDQLAASSAAELARVRAAVAESEAERSALRERVGALIAAEAQRGTHLTTLVSDRERAEAERREAKQRAEQLATELAVVQAETLRLRDDRARVLAAVDDDSAEPVTVIRALREQVVALEGQLTAHADERSELTRRGAAEARAMEERVAMARAERDAVEAGHQRERQAIQALHARTLDETVAAHRKELEDVAMSYQREREAAAADMERLDVRRRAALTDAESLRMALGDAERARGEMEITASARASTSAGIEEADESADRGIEGDLDAGRDLAPTGIEVVQRSGHHILESDAVRWDQIHAALSAALPSVPGRSLMVVNLLSAFPAGLYDLTAAAKAGASIVGYAADAHGRSRILGAVRCFTDPPSATEAAAVFDATAKGPRRVLTLSDDVEAFTDAKAGLAKAGHSVSMACDAKQALDLLAMFTPDAVFIDLRTAPTAAAEFLAALAPESGRVLVVLVHGDPEGNVLPCMIQRLLRPAPLDPADLVTVCRDVLAGPSLSTVRTSPVKVIRPLERPNGAKVLPRKPLARRIVPRRR